MRYNFRDIVILGAGESGIGAALLAKSKGYQVFVSDCGEIKSCFKKELLEAKIPFEELKHSYDKINLCSLVVLSPGISKESEVVKYVEKLNRSYISEIEFASLHCNAYKICITGTNGKTTTTSLIYHILKKAGLDVAIAGNIGKSYSRVVSDRSYDYVVLEISSFQLDSMFDFKANIAILLNITPDHLDRYDHSMLKYVESKFRILNNQTEDDFFIYNTDDASIASFLINKTINSNKLPYGDSLKIKQGAILSNENITININSKSFTMSINSLALKGKHNVYNSMAAGIAARVLDIRKDIIKESLSDFQNIEHRLEFVSKVRGIEFINDSKATNVNATWYALECMSSSIIWIAGGQDKGNDYEMLKTLVAGKVKALICLGVDNTKLKQVFNDVIPVIIETQSAEDAVKNAYRIGEQGDIVLLSPACASFDLFKNYEDRGNQFKDAVRNL